MSPHSVKTLKDLVLAKGGSVGLKASSSSVIVANLNATTAPLCVGAAFDDDELSTDEFRLLYFLLDGSSSMEDVIAALRESMNEVVFPGLLGGAAKEVGAIRFGGCVYASDVRPLWPGWRKLEKNFPRLTAAELSASGSTSLNKAVLDGVTALTTQALQVKAETGTHPECCLICVGDGANNQAPLDPRQVKMVMDDLDPRYFTLAFLGFETWEPVDFTSIAQGLGFRDIQAARANPGESIAEQQRRMRHMMKVFSQNLIQRVSSSRVGTSAAMTPASGTGFWAGN